MMNCFHVRWFCRLPFSGVITCTGVKLLQEPSKIDSTKLASQDGMGLVIDVG